MADLVSTGNGECIAGVSRVDSPIGLRTNRLSEFPQQSLTVWRSNGMYNKVGIPAPAGVGKNRIGDSECDCGRLFDQAKLKVSREELKGVQGGGRYRHAWYSCQCNSTSCVRCSAHVVVATIKSYILHILDPQRPVP